MSPEEIIKLYQDKEADRSTWDTMWQDISDYISPRKSDILDEKTPDVEGYTDRIHDTTVVEANQTLAAGTYDYVVSGKWFDYDAPKQLEKDHEAKKWYAECGEIALDEINKSNFPLEFHEMLLDRGGFGTNVILLEEGTRSTLRFRNFPIATYILCEDDEGFVDTIIRKFELTAEQCAKRFGVENLTPKIAKAFAKDKTRRQKFKILHAIYPRFPEIVGATGNAPEDKPVASQYISECDKMFLRDSGFDEMPAFAGRYLCWQGHVYGFCPSVFALPTVRGVNFKQKMRKALAELAAFPRILIPEGMEGDIDLRSSGITIFNPNEPNAMPKEWATQGRYDVCIDDIRDDREMINKMYHVDLFKALAERDKNMTATEVLELVEEKLVNFSPTFARLKVEILDPMLLRVFNMLYRAGRFPQAPQSVMQIMEGGGVAINVPEVNYVSKLAMAMKALENKSFLNFMALVREMVELKPRTVNLISDNAPRLVAENMGVSPDFLNDEEEVEAINQAQDEQEQAQQELMAAESASKSMNQMGATVPNL